MKVGGHGDAQVPELGVVVGHAQADALQHGLEELADEAVGRVAARLVEAHARKLVALDEAEAERVVAAHHLVGAQLVPAAAERLEGDADDRAELLDQVDVVRAVVGQHAQVAYMIVDHLDRLEARTACQFCVVIVVVVVFIPAAAVVVGIECDVGHLGVVGAVADDVDANAHLTKSRRRRWVPVFAFALL